MIPLSDAYKTIGDAWPVECAEVDAGGAPPSISSMTDCILSLVSAHFIGERLIEPALCCYFAEATARLSLRIFTSAYER